MKPYKVYSSVLNRQPCTFISGKVCILTLIEAKRQTLAEISVGLRRLQLLDTPEYMLKRMVHIIEGKDTYLINMNARLLPAKFVS